MAIRGAAWSRDELVAALKLYCLTPFGRIHSRNPAIVALAKELGRTPSSVALKMTNFASLDPTIDRAGMGNYSRLDKIVWDDFFGNMESYLVPQERATAPLAAYEAPTEFRFGERAGLDVLRLTKTRVNQSFFRSMVLTSYDNKCALTGIEAPELLVASHIRPWALDHATRTNPRNGICLNTLHDRAFDEGLITLEEDTSVRYSPLLPAIALEALKSISDTKLRLPSRFLPDSEFLNYHRTEVFKAG